MISFRFSVKMIQKSIKKLKAKPQFIKKRSPKSKIESLMKIKAKNRCRF